MTTGVTSLTKITANNLTLLYKDILDGTMYYGTDYTYDDNGVTKKLGFVCRFSKIHEYDICLGELFFGLSSYGKTRITLTGLDVSGEMLGYTIFNYCKNLEFLQDTFELTPPINQKILPTKPDMSKMKDTKSVGALHEFKIIFSGEGQENAWEVYIKGDNITYDGTYIDFTSIQHTEGEAKEMVKLYNTSKKAFIELDPQNEFIPPISNLMEGNIDKEKSFEVL